MIGCVHDKKTPVFAKICLDTGGRCYSQSTLLDIQENSHKHSEKHSQNNSLTALGMRLAFGLEQSHPPAYPSAASSCDGDGERIWLKSTKPGERTLLGAKGIATSNKGRYVRGSWPNGTRFATNGAFSKGRLHIDAVPPGCLAQPAAGHPLGPGFPEPPQPEYEQSNPGAKPPKEQNEQESEVEKRREREREEREGAGNFCVFRKLFQLLLTPLLASCYY